MNKVKDVYHIVYHLKNLCGVISTNSIIGDNKSLENIEKIIENNRKFVRLCERCKKSKKKNEI